MIKNGWRPLVLMALCWIGGDRAMGSEKNSAEPIEVVNRRMGAYNAHDIDAFLATYSPDVVIYGYPDTVLGQGHEHLERIFAEMFETKSNHVKIRTQIERQEYVINDELVSYTKSKASYVSIYEVRDGLIHSVRFVGRD